MILNKLIKYFFIIFLVKISNLLSYELNILGNEKLSLQDIQTLTQIEINKIDLTSMILTRLLMIFIKVN